MSSQLGERADPAPVRPWLACSATSFALIALVGLAGVSAAVPPWGSGLGPPLALHLGLPSGAVTVLLWLAYLIGAVGVWLGLRVRQRISGSDAALGTAGIALASLLAAPLGSADHLSYIAYGRIKALGGDPYRTSPDAWLATHPHDAVIAGVQPPWTDTVSVYGPVGTAVQTAVGWLGRGQLQPTVWLWQVVCVLAYLALVRLLWAMTFHRWRTRVLVLVAWNPVLVGPVVLGAHVDVLAMALAASAVAAGFRRPLLAGALAAAAMSVKAPYAVVLLGLLVAALPWGDRISAVRSRHVLTRGILGAAVVLVIGHVWSGPHTYDQTRTAGQFTSLSTPWRAAVNLASLAWPGARDTVLALVPVVVALAAWAVWVVTRGRRSAVRDRHRQTVWLTVLVVGGGWVLAAPYVLPWYDLLLWVPLALLAPRCGRELEVLVLIHTTMLALAYVPGRITAMSPLVEEITLGVRSYLSPVVLLGLGAVLVHWAMAERRAARAPAGPRQPGERPLPNH